MSSNDTVVFPSQETVTIEERSVPEPGPGQVLIETDLTLISTGTELTVLSGSFPEDSNWAAHATYPFTPGYNNVGRVVEVGDDVTAIDVGQRVATLGSHAQYVVTVPGACRPIPDGISDEEAVFFTFAEIGMNGVRRGEVTWGQSVVVTGLGLLGQIALRCCQVAGARPVVGVDVAPSRLEYLPDRAGVVGVNPLEEDTAEVVGSLTDGRLADVAFEVTGNPDTITGQFEPLRDQGRLVVLGSPRGPTSIDFHDYCNSPSYHIVGAHNNSHPPVATPQNPWTKKRHCELFFEYLSDGSLSVASLVSHRRPYTDAPDLYASLLDDRTDLMGVLLEW